MHTRSVVQLKSTTIGTHKTDDILDCYRIV